MTSDKIKEKYGVNQVWSWSRYKCYKDDRYVFYLKYILKTIPDMPSSRYSEMGSGCHAIMEDLYNGKIKYKEMPELFEEVIFDADVKQLKYDRSDEDKNLKIKHKYEESIRLFFKNHCRIPYKLKSEAYILTFIGKYLFQGYVDASHNDNGNLIITDWKTSTIYKGEKLLKEKGQLLIYAIAFANYGISPDRIKLRWNFLKYTDVTTSLANGSQKKRTILRCELGKSLYSNVKMWLKKLGYTEDEEILTKLCITNDINTLPSDVREKYIVDDCYVYVECTETNLNEFKHSIIRILDEASNKIELYDSTKDENIWWKEVTTNDTYFLFNLCEYSAKFHKPLKKYLDELEERKKENVLTDKHWAEKLF